MISLPLSEDRELLILNRETLREPLAVDATLDPLLLSGVPGGVEHTGDGGTSRNGLAEQSGVPFEVTELRDPTDELRLLLLLSGVPGESVNRGDRHIRPHQWYVL